MYTRYLFQSFFSFIFVLLILHRYREKDSKFTNWIELPVNPPDARNIQIHDLNANTRYEFQVIGTNEYGDGMFSEIIEASTKGKIPTLVETSRYTYIVDILKSANTYLTLNYLYHPCGLDFLLTNSLRIHQKITHFLATKNCPIKTWNN